jgi:hypothetical protein
MGFGVTEILDNAALSGSFWAVLHAPQNGSRMLWLVNASRPQFFRLVFGGTANQKQ